MTTTSAVSEPAVGTAGAVPDPDRGWTIAAAMLPFPGVAADGTAAQDQDQERWRAAFAALRELGFAAADLTDSWVRPGDLAESRLLELREAAAAAGIELAAVSVIRRSVIDPVSGDENLAYSHRSVDAAALLGCATVSVGLHRPLTETQRAQLWFWTVDGPHDAEDRETWDRAVSRLRELGRHAGELGLRLSLEMYEDTLLGTGESAVRLVHDIGLDNVGLNPDLGNLVRAPRPIESVTALVDATVPLANFWHVKNCLRLEDPVAGVYLAAPSSLEVGVINYRYAVEVAVRAGFDGALCLEQYGGDGLGAMASNLRYLRSLLPVRAAS